MKNILLLIGLYATAVTAQTTLKFDKRFVESENKWIAVRTSKDSVMNFGFVYIDRQAGLTLEYAGSFTIEEGGKFIPKKLDSFGVKYRLEPSNTKVAFIPSEKYNDLQIKNVPDWLGIYKSDTSSIDFLYYRGFLCNGWGECAKALTYLEKAQKINSKFNGLPVELAFSYNCLGQFDKAILVLQNALETNPSDAYTNKELIYAQIKSGQLDKASESCKKALALCIDQSYNGENCYNLLHNYYKRKDKTNFTLWLQETKKWTSTNANLTNNIKTMEADLTN